MVGVRAASNLMISSSVRVRLSLASSSNSLQKFTVLRDHQTDKFYKTMVEGRPEAWQPPKQSGSNSNRAMGCPTTYQ